MNAYKNKFDITHLFDRVYRYMGTSLRKSVLEDDHNLEILSLVWLDALVNSIPENIDVQKQLRTLINHLKTFDNSNECLQFIRNISKQNRIILIVSGRLGQEIVPHIHRLRQILCIYVYCMDKEKNEKWAHKFSKIKGVIVNLDQLVGQIRSDRAKRNFCEIDEPFSFNIYKKILPDEQSAMDANNRFIHLELLIDCLLHTKSNLTDKNQFISLCQDIYQGNKNELSIIDEFEKNYTSNKALEWYRKDSFVSHLLYKAFQSQTIDLLYLFRFFIHDIQEQLDLNKYLLPIHVYRGQYLSNDELEIFQNSIGDFISINSFLSTNLTRQKALKQLTDIDELSGVLFEIDADPRLPGIKSFGFTGQDDEILFMVGSIFRIYDVSQQQHGLSIIRMKLCSDNDPQLKIIFKSLKTEINDGETNVLVFGDVLWKIGKFTEAEKYYQRLLTELSDDNYHDISECYYALGNLAMEKEDYNSSFECHEKSLEIKKQILKVNDSSIADSYNSIADINRKKGNSVQALEFYNKALDIWTQAYGNDHPKIAMCLNNIGCIYGEEKNYLKTLEYQEQALKIMEKHFSSDHLCLGQAHNNIGSVYRYLGNYELALEHYQISVKIKLKSFSSKHPLIASTFSNIANVYEEMNSLQQALEYYEKAASIYRNRFPPTHPDNLRIIEDIRRISKFLRIRCLLFQINNPNNPNLLPSSDDPNAPTPPPSYGQHLPSISRARARSSARGGSEMQQPSVPLRARAPRFPSLLSTTTPCLQSTPSTNPLPLRTTTTTNLQHPVPSRTTTTTNPGPPLQPTTATTTNPDPPPPSLTINYLHPPPFFFFFFFCFFLK